MNTKDILEQIENTRFKGLADQSKKRAVLKKTVVELLNQGVNLSYKLNAYGTLTFYINDKPAQIRVAIVDGRKDDHTHFKERFNVTTRAKEYEYSIFVIENVGNLWIYVFNQSDLLNIQTLSLAFYDNSNGGRRKSVYDKALRNWEILKS